MNRRSALSAALLLLPLLAPPVASAQRKTVASAATCTQVPDLQKRFEELTQEINLDRQIIRNFGFEKTVAEIEYAGALEERRLKEAKEQVFELMFAVLADKARAAIRAAGSLSAADVDVINRMVDAQGDPALGKVVAGARDVDKALDILENAKDGYNRLSEFRRRELLTAVHEIAKSAAVGAAVAVGAVAASSAATAAALLGVAEWAWYQVYQSLDAVRIVKNLTEATEGDLALLRTRSEKLRKEVDELAEVRRQLAALGPQCSSTRMVRAPKKGGSGGKVAAGLLVGGGLGVGAYMLGKELAKQDSIKNAGGGTVSGRCVGTASANACAACTCTPNVNCSNSPQCGGSGCWTSSAVPPFC